VDFLCMRHKTLITPNVIQGTRSNSIITATTLAVTIAKKKLRHSEAMENGATLDTIVGPSRRLIAMV
jgi:hypothetical protein